MRLIFHNAVFFCFFWLVFVPLMSESLHSLALKKERKKRKTLWTGDKRAVFCDLIPPFN